MHAQGWCNVSKQNDKPRERRPPSTTLRVAVASAVCAVPCSVVFAVRCAIKSTEAHDVIGSFLPDLNRLKHDDVKKGGFADGFWGRAQVQRDHNALVSTGVQNCAKGNQREAPTASIHGHGDASVFGPNDADRRGTGACPKGYLFYE